MESVGRAMWQDAAAAVELQGKRDERDGKGERQTV